MAETRGNKCIAGEKLMGQRKILDTGKWGVVFPYPRFYRFVLGVQ